MLYPPVLPDGARLDEILQYSNGEEGTDIVFVFYGSAICFQAQNYDLALLGIKDDMEVIEVNGYRTGILYTPKIEFPYNAYLTVDGFAYNIGAQDRETLLFLLENLKKSGS